MTSLIRALWARFNFAQGSGYRLQLIALPEGLVAMLTTTCAVCPAHRAIGEPDSVLHTLYAKNAISLAVCRLISGHATG